MIRRRRPFKRNLKGLEIVPPPPEISLEEVAERCRYVGSGYHRTMLGSVGSPRFKPRGTKCPDDLQRDPIRVQDMLRDAIRAGHCGQFDGEFPRRVWHRVGDTIFEARQGPPGSGEYHGYPLDEKQTNEFLRRNADI